MTPTNLPGDAPQNNPQRQTTHQPRPVMATFVIVSSVALTLIVCELALLLFFPVPFAIEDNMYFESDPHTGYRLMPNSIGHFIMGIEGKANSHGHRDDDISLARPENTLRILVLGDSFTVGANVTQQQAFPQVLERRLQQRFDETVEVVNTGVGGWGPFQYSQYYEHYGRRFGAQVIVVGFFVGNDTYSQENQVEHTRTAINGRRVSRDAAISKSTRVKMYFYQNSHLARLLLTRINRVWLMNDFEIPRDDCQDFTSSYLEFQRAGIARYERDSANTRKRARNNVNQLTKIKEMADADRATLLVALLPDEIQVNTSLRESLFSGDQIQEHDFEMPQSMLRKHLHELGIEFVDMLPNFRNDAACVYMNDTHWNPEGHRLAADILADALYESLQELSRQVD